jgi:hypothetical protein
MLEPPIPSVGDFVRGERPIHVHTCWPEGFPTSPNEVKPNHNWRCNSPYCEILTSRCVPHGGDHPYEIGREPWRGR